MIIYELDFLDEDKKVIETSPSGGITAKNKVKEVDIGNIVLVLCQIKEWESVTELAKAHEALNRIFEKRVIIINHPNAKEIKFARLKMEKTTYPDRKSPYSRKLRLGRKHDIKNTEEADAKVCEKEEEIPEEKTSTGDEESTVGWRWPH